MSDEGPRDYDKIFTTPAGRRARRRLGLEVEAGEVVRFVVQLEYLLDPLADEWATVVRYNHDSRGADEATYDVTKEGLHIDLYRDRAKVATHELTLPLPAGDALDAAEDHLAEHLEGYVERFELWQGIRPDDR